MTSGLSQVTSHTVPHVAYRNCLFPCAPPPPYPTIPGKPSFLAYFCLHPSTSLWPRPVRLVAFFLAPPFWPPIAVRQYFRLVSRDIRRFEGRRFSPTLHTAVPDNSFSSTVSACPWVAFAKSRPFSLSFFTTIRDVSRASFFPVYRDTNAISFPISSYSENIVF